MNHPTVSREQWLAARLELLDAEKAQTHARAALLEKRRALPWVRVEQDYQFDGPHGKVSLADLFQGRSQLFIYHFMLGPGWDDPCEGCSFIADHVDAARQHFEQADLSFAAVSRASIAEIQRVKERMGWDFTWVSAHDSPFNYDFQVSFTEEQLKNNQAIYNYQGYDGDELDLHGSSIFVRAKDGQIYHTYSSYGRGDEALIGAFSFLDYTPRGRAEEEGIMAWVKLHDQYNEPNASASCGCSCCD